MVLRLASIIAPGEMGVVFVDIVYDLKKRRILDGVSGRVQRGEFLTLIGPSGAGKSTLLQILTGNLTPTAGSVGVYGGATMAFAPQEDYLLPFLTVRETLDLAAELRLAEKKTVVVGEVLVNLGLTETINTRIAKTSGGERKRAALAVELLAKPAIFVADEPTSGLDSASAMIVSKMLSSLKETAVLCSMHQPSTKIFIECLRDVAVLSRSGTLVYSGPASEAVKEVSLVTSKDLQYLASPGEFLLDVATDPDLLIESPHVLLLPKDDDDDETMTTTEMNSPSLEMRPGPSKWLQFVLLLRRCVLNTRRSPAATYAALGRSVTTAFLVGGLYWTSTPGDECTELSQTAVRDRTGALFFVLVHQSFAAVGSVRAFLEERTVYELERKRGLSDPVPYFGAKSAAEFPLQAFFAVLFASIAYPLVGFRPSLSAFLAHVGILGMTTLVAESLVLAVSAVSPDAKTAVVVAPVVLSVALLSAGFLVDLADKPLAFLRSTSYFARAFSAAAKIEFRHRQVACAEQDKADLAHRLVHDAGLPATLFDKGNVLHDLPCPIPDGDAHLDRLLGRDAREPITSFDLPALFLLVVVFRLAALGILARIGRPPRATTVADPPSEEAAKHPHDNNGYPRLRGLAAKSGPIVMVGRIHTATNGSRSS